MTSAPAYKKAVIIGAAGFIGINLARFLAERGYELICFDRVKSAHWPAAATAITGDFFALPPALLDQLDQALVFHLVSSHQPSARTEQAAVEAEQDIATTIRFLEATRGRDIRWVFLSSGGTVYGPSSQLPIPETNPTLPICSYGVVKLTVERYFALYKTLHQTDYIIARLGNPYGPWQSPFKGQGLIAALLHKAMNGQMIEIWGDGGNIRDYIFITDAIAGIYAAALSPLSGDIYNIGTGQGYSINQLIELIETKLGMDIKACYAPARSVDVRTNILDIAKVSRDTRWAPQIALADGLAQTAGWLRENMHI